MPIDINRNYDVINVVDIPENEISEKLKEALKDKPRYQEVDGIEHLYNASQVLESENLGEEVIVELESIEELCHKYTAIYFRITKV